MLSFLIVKNMGLLIYVDDGELLFPSENYHISPSYYKYQNIVKKITKMVDKMTVGHL